MSIDLENQNSNIVVAEPIQPHIIYIQEVYSYPNNLNYHRTTTQIPINLDNGLYENDNNNQITNNENNIHQTHINQKCCKKSCDLSCDCCNSTCCELSRMYCLICTFHLCNNIKNISLILCTVSFITLIITGTLLNSQIH